MSSNERFTERGSSIAANCKRLEKEVEVYQNSLNEALRAAVAPVVELPTALNQVLKEGRLDDAKKLGDVTKLIARDADELLADKTKIDGEFKELIANRPDKKRKLSDHHSSVMVLGAKYLELNEKAVHTVLKNIDTYAELVNPAAVTEAKHEESEAAS